MRNALMNNILKSSTRVNNISIRIIAVTIFSMSNISINEMSMSLDRFFTNNEKLITQLETLTFKFDQLLSNPNNNSPRNSTVRMLNGKKLKRVQVEKDRHWCTCRYKWIKGENSKKYSTSSSKHQKEARRRDTKNGPSNNRNWTCSCYDGKGFWVPIELRD